MKFPTIKSKKDSLYITLFFLFSIACIAGLRYEQRLEMQKGIAEKIIRFHVIANSDTKADQNLKLAVRDAVGIKMSGLLKDAADRSRSEAVIRKNMEDMKQTAEKVIAERPLFSSHTYACTYKGRISWVIYSLAVPHLPVPLIW